MAPASNLDESGFSLIEVIFAIGILGTGLVTVSGLLMTSVDALLAARQRTVAVTLAGAKLEDLMADGPALRDGADGGDRVNAAGGLEPDRSGWFLRQWSVRASPAFPDRLAIASVRVTPPAGARLHVQDVQLVTTVERPR